MSVGFSNTKLLTGTVALDSGFPGRLILLTTENLTADRTMSIVVNDANFQFFLTGSATLSNCVISNLFSSQATVTTTDGTATTIAGFNINPSQSVTISGTINASRNDYSQGLAGTFQVCARRAAAGSPVIVGGLTDAGFIGQSDNSSLSVTSAISGNSLLLVVTGQAGATFNWKTQYTLITN